MSAREYNREGLLTAVLAGAIVCAGVFFALARMYAAGGMALLAPLDKSVGEVLWREAIRLEAAGQNEAALERYEQALASKFEAGFNRTDALKRSGALLWSLGRHADAVAPLREALEGSYATPSAFEPLADALYNLGRVDELNGVLARWEADAAKRGDVAAQAAVKFHAGRLAYKRGDKDAAIALHEAGNALAPGGRNASDLAILYDQKGDKEKSLRYTEEFIAHGGGGARAKYMRELRERLLRDMKKQ